VSPQHSDDVASPHAAGVRDALDRYWRKLAGERERAELAASKPRAERKHEEADTQRAIVRALRRLPGVWIARNTVGAGRYDNGGIVTYGLGTGSADLLAVVAPHGRACWLEVKSSTGRPTESQLAFGEKQQSLGAVYCVVRSVEEALRAIEEARR
jgi:hypothetical protein